MTSAKELGRRAAREEKARRAKEEMSALTGKLRSDGSISLAGDSAYNDTLPANMIYVRLFGREVETATAYWTGTKPNTPVIVRKAIQGSRAQYRVTDIDHAKASTMFGAFAGSAASPPIDGRVTPIRIYGSNFMDGLVYVAAAGGLTVAVTPFRYTDSAGNEATWLGEDSGTLSLASSVPAAVAGINQQRWVIIALNPDATTPALVAVDGTAIAVTGTLQESAAGNVAVTAGYIRLEAIRLQTGDTSWDESRRSTITVRRFLTESIQPRLLVSTANVSNPPTDAELDSAFGTPAARGAGFTAIVNDNNAATNEYLVWSDGANWWYSTGTKAT